MSKGYTCEWYQLFNVFGAPGIPNTYAAVLYDGEGYVRAVERFHWKKRAKAQCREWREDYGAKIL